MWKYACFRELILLYHMCFKLLQICNLELGTKNPARVVFIVGKLTNYKLTIYYFHKWRRRTRSKNQGTCFGSFRLVIQFVMMSYTRHSFRHFFANRKRLCKQKWNNKSITLINLRSFMLGSCFSGSVNCIIKFVCKPVLIIFCYYSWKRNNLYSRSYPRTRYSFTIHLTMRHACSYKLSRNICCTSCTGCCFIQRKKLYT